MPNLSHVERIDALIAKSGRSAKQICAEARVSATGLSNARSGSGKLRLETLEALAPVLGVDLPYLLGLPSPTAAEGPGDLRRIPLANLERSELNPRHTFEDAPLKELAESIAEQGLLQNLVVRQATDNPDRYLIVAGERRYRALIWLAEEARLPDDIAEWGVPVRVINGDDAQHLALALLENLQRQDVNPMEEAEGFAQLQAIDPDRWRPSHIAEKIGCSARHVQQRLALVSRLCPEAQTALRAGQITFTHARALLLREPSQQAEHLADTLQSDLSASALHARITKGLIPTSRAIFPLDLYSGVIVEENGNSYFEDKDTFFAAQSEAVERRAEALRPTWAWVEIVTTYWCSMFDIADQSNCDSQVSGVRIHLHPETGAVVEHSGLLKSVECEDAKAAREQEQAERSAKEADLDQFSADLTQAVTKHPQAAFAFLLLNELYQLSGLAPSFSMPAAVFDRLTALKDLELERLRPDKTKLSDAWERLVAAPDLGGTVTAWIAERISVRYGYSPLTALLAKTLNVQIPPHLIEGK